MRAIFVDANPSLAAVTEKLLRRGDPPVAINRDPDVKPADLPRLLAGCPVAIETLPSGQARVTVPGGPHRFECR